MCIQAAKDEIMTRVKADAMTPYLEYLTARYGWASDDAMLKTLK